MKTITSAAARIILAILLPLAMMDACKRPENTQNPNSTIELPPYTETGANTYGCTINGRVFIPEGTHGFPKIMCSYVELNGRRAFSLGAATIDGDNTQSVVILMDTAYLKQDSVYTLGWERESKNSAKYIYGAASIAFPRLPLTKGELHIKRFDSVRGILSGTFWFDGRDTLTGDRVQIRDGRFDVLVRY